MIPRSFLDLPKAIRLRIYNLAGLTRPCPIDMVPPRSSSMELKLRRERGAAAGVPCYVTEQMKEGSSGAVNCRDCACPRIPVELFLVSKAIFSETHTTFYSKNKFVLRAHKAVDLTTLQSLTSQAIATMTFLLIRLNCWPCPWGHDAIDYDSNCQICSTPVTDSDPVLHLDTQSGQEMAATWAVLCAKLSAHITPSQVDLTFICDTALPEDAKQITSSLMALPPLKKCTIRLGRAARGLSISPVLRSISQDVSLKMTQEFIPQKTFPWAKLPRELRLQILGHTHLGPRSTYKPNLSELRVSNNKLIKGRSYREACCSKCTYTFADCCCPSAHAAYSAGCECRLWPWELFYVSKEMYGDAFEVFYAKNVFVFDQDLTTTTDFFELLPPKALSLIRRVEFVLYEMDIDEWDEKELGEQWSKLVEYIKFNMDVSRLSITINLQSWAEYFQCNDEDGTEGTEDEDLWAKEDVYDRYWLIADELSTLEGLENVRFELGYWKDLKPLLEKRVMGARWKERYQFGDRREDNEHVFELDWAVPRWHHRFYKESDDKTDTKA